MRKLALFFGAVVAVAVLSLPPAAHAQAKCGNDLCIGSPGTQLHVKGNIIADRPILSGTSGSVIIDGGLTIVGTLVTTGTSTPATVNASGTVSAASVDAGTLFVRGNEQHAGTVQGTFTVDLVDAGNVNIQGVLGLNQAVHCGADLACGTIALSSGTPSTATKTVTSGSTCFCWPVGTTAAIAAGGCAANVSSTTATFTGPNTVTTTVGYICTK